MRTTLIIALAVICLTAAIIYSISDSEGMVICQIAHSYDTCHSSLFR